MNAWRETSVLEGQLSPTVSGCWLPWSQAAPGLLFRYSGEDVLYVELQMRLDLRWGRVLINPW